MDSSISEIGHIHFCKEGFQSKINYEPSHLDLHFCEGVCVGLHGCKGERFADFFSFLDFCLIYIIVPHMRDVLRDSKTYLKYLFTSCRCFKRSACWEKIFSKRRFEIFFLIFKKTGWLRHFMHTVSLGDSVHEMSKPVFWGKTLKNMSSICRLLHQPREW